MFLSFAFSLPRFAMSEFDVAAVHQLAGQCMIRLKEETKQRKKSMAPYWRVVKANAKKKRREKREERREKKRLQQAADIKELQRTEKNKKQQKRQQEKTKKAKEEQQKRQQEKMKARPASRRA